MQDLVRDASAGDAFVFFCLFLSLLVLALFDISPLDAGHSAQQAVTTDPNEVDGLGECSSDLYYFTHSP